MSEYEVCPECGEPLDRRVVVTDDETVDVAYRCFNCGKDFSANEAEMEDADERGWGEGE